MRQQGRSRRARRYAVNRRVLIPLAVLVVLLAVLGVSVLRTEAVPEPVASGKSPTAGTPSPSPSPSSRPTASTRSFAIDPATNPERKVFAHYFPPYPISIDNEPAADDYYARNYLDPDGEEGIHASYGGLLRDRPLPRPPLEGDWQSADLATEIEQAQEAGIDGFAVDLLGFEGRNWETVQKLVRAAEQAEQPFLVLPTLDASSGAVSAPMEDIADDLALLFESPATYRLPDGRHVLSSFKAEGQDPDWWQDLLSELERRHQVDAAFIAVLLDPSEANMEAFAPISYALSIWGPRSPDQEALERAITRARRLDVRWMSPVAVQDARPNGGNYAEAGNTETLRTMWDIAITRRADLVQLVTWNDYSESTTMAPSVSHGRSFLDINAYYLSRYKSGAAPRITHDSLYLTHRRQFFDGVGRTGSQEPMRPDLGGSTTPPRNTVEVVAFLTRSTTLEVGAGTRRYSVVAPAGFSAYSFPLARGAVWARATRGPQVVCSVRSPFEVTVRPEVQDLQYVAANSLGR